jgi:hypothetical protein
MENVKHKFGNYNHVDTAIADISKGVAVGAAIGTAVPLIGNAVGAAGGAIVGAGFAIVSAIQANDGAFSDAAQNSILNARNLLIFSQPTYKNVADFNSKIWNNFQGLDQAKINHGGHDAHEYIIYFTPDGHISGNLDNYGYVNGRSLTPASQGKNDNDKIPISEMFIVINRASVIDQNLQLYNVGYMAFPQPILSTTKSVDNAVLTTTGDNLANHSITSGINTPIGTSGSLNMIIIVAAVILIVILIAS